ISVVIVYAGHGSRVKRTEAALKEDPSLSEEESTWVASDAKGSGPESANADVRASELAKIHAALSQLGAEIVMISDACHSGIGFRDAGVKVRAITRDVLPPGPREDMFPNLSRPPKSRDVTANGTIDGFVWYAACGNRGFAYEARDESGRPAGYFSSALM